MPAAAELNPHLFIFYTFTYTSSNSTNITTLYRKGKLHNSSDPGLAHCITTNNQALLYGQKLLLSLWVFLRPCFVIKFTKNKECYVDTIVTAFMFAPARISIWHIFLFPVEAAKWRAVLPN